jgi:hypothetical protein
LVPQLHASAIRIPMRDAEGRQRRQFEELWAFSRAGAPILVRTPEALGEDRAPGARAVEDNVIGVSLKTVGRPYQHRRQDFTPGSGQSLADLEFFRQLIGIGNRDYTNLGLATA